MARQPDMINEVITLLGEGKSTKEITEKTGCSKSTVTVARKRLKDREGDLTEATNDINADVDDNIDSFIKKIKIIPPPETKESDDSADNETEYQCPGCGHVWSGDKTERQGECPGCRMEFE